MGVARWSQMHRFPVYTLTLTLRFIMTVSTTNIIAGRVGRGTKVHRLLRLTNYKDGIPCGTFLHVSCGADQARGLRSNSTVRKVEGGADAITCKSCLDDIEKYG